MKHKKEPITEPITNGLPFFGGGGVRIYPPNSVDNTMSKFYDSIAREVKRRRKRETLSKKDSLVRYLSECSGEKILRFVRAIENYAEKMGKCGAEIEKGLARQAAEDLNKGDYRSSRIKYYEHLLDLGD